MGKSIEISRLPERIVYCSVRCWRNVTKYTAVYKTGTGRRGRGHWDACLGTLRLGNARRRTWGHQVWDVGTSGAGTRGRQIQGRRDVNDYCKSRREMRYQSLSSWICLSEHNPPCPPYEARTRRRPPALKKVKLLSWYSCWWNIGALNRVGWVTVTKVYIE